MWDCRSSLFNLYMSFNKPPEILQHQWRSLKAVHNTACRHQDKEKHVCVCLKTSEICTPSTTWHCRRSWFPKITDLQYCLFPQRFLQISESFDAFMCCRWSHIQSPHNFTLSNIIPGWWTSWETHLTDLLLIKLVSYQMFLQLFIFPAFCCFNPTFYEMCCCHQWCIFSFIHLCAIGNKIYFMRLGNHCLPLFFTFIILHSIAEILENTRVSDPKFILILRCSIRQKSDRRLFFSSASQTRNRGWGHAVYRISVTSDQTFQMWNWTFISWISG